MSDVSIKVDTSDFDEVFTNYIAVTGYTVKQAMFYQLRNWLVQAGKTRQNQDAKFLQSVDPAMVSFLMSTNKFGVGHNNPREYDKNTLTHRWHAARQRKFIAPHLSKNGKMSKGRWQKARASGFSQVAKAGVTFRQRRMSVRVLKNGDIIPNGMQFYSRAEAKMFYRKHFDLRKRASRFLAAFLWKMKQELNDAADSFGGTVQDANQRLGKAINAQAYGTSEGSDVIGVGVSAQYGYKHETTAAKKVTTQTSANRLEKIIQQALEFASAQIIPNMEEKIAIDLEKIATGRKRFSI